MSLRKRDSKAKSKEEDKEEKKRNSNKEETKGEEVESDLERDEKGNPVLEQLDFENPIIVHYETADKAEDFKVNWKEIELAVKKDFNRLKIVYARADQHMGELAVSSHKTHAAQLAKIDSAELNVQGKIFKFHHMKGEELKEFWKKQGGHYNFCI